MADDVVRPRLGRGLAALIGDFGDDSAAASKSQEQRKVAVEFLRPNPRNPRRRFHESDLEELSASIKLRGIIQPIVVRALAGVPDTYEIVAGERRGRAAQMAEVHELPAVVRELVERTIRVKAGVVSGDPGLLPRHSYS